MMASVPPYIFTKHVYAVASIAGGILLCVIYPYVDKYIGLFITSAFVVVLRLLASRFRWEIPKAEDVSLHHTKNHSGKNDVIILQKVGSVKAPNYKTRTLYQEIPY